MANLDAYIADPNKMFVQKNEIVEEDKIQF